MSLINFFQQAKYRRLLFAGFSSFILIGAVLAMYGPAFLSFQAKFGLSEAAVGLIVSLHFIGSLVTILASGFLVSKFGYRLTLNIGACLLGLGALGIALSPSWPLVLASALLIGVGFGVFDAGMNMLFGRSFEENSAPALNLLNAMFSIGAMIGPLIIALFLRFPSLNVQWAFFSMAALALLTLILCLGLPNPQEASIDSKSVSIPWGKFTGFILIFFFYVMAEIGVASWEPSHLAPAYGEARGALFTSLYWGALAVGRFVATPISAFVKPSTLVLGSTILALIGACLTFFTGVAPFAYMLIGFAFAPIFPTGLAWLGRVFPARIEQLTPLVMAAANIGAIISSPAIGWAIGLSSSAIIPLVLSLAIGVLFLVTLGTWLKARA